MCCAFQLTVCWPTENETKKNPPTYNKLLNSNTALLESCDIAQPISSNVNHSSKQAEVSGV